MSVVESPEKAQKNLAAPGRSGGTSSVFSMDTKKMLKMKVAPNG
jgi:hypothetical protein